MKNHLAEIEKSISAKRFYDLLTFVREPLAPCFFVKNYTIMQFFPFRKVASLAYFPYFCTK